MTSPVHITAADLEGRWRDIGSGWSLADVLLHAGDTAWDPGSTKRVIHGPGAFRYRRAPDGGVDVYRVDPPSTPRPRASVTPCVNYGGYTVRINGSWGIGVNFQREAYAASVARAINDNLALDAEAARRGGS